LTIGWSLFIASGVIWVAALIPIEVMKARMAKRFATEAVIPAVVLAALDAVVRLRRSRDVLPLANLYFMVFKPD
jgi:hypothetical protein